MAEISLLLGDGFVFQPIEQTMVWAVFYATLFWLPVRGVAAVFERGSYEEDEFEYEAEHEGRRGPSRPVYHIGMKILPPI